MEQFVSEFPNCEGLLVELLSDPSQIVVAHALLTLEMLSSKHLQHLSGELLARKSKLTLDFGSIRTSMDLGGLARQIQKRAL
jgi:hypothetical protein